MEKNMKNNVYICITESLCCTAEINTMLQIGYTSIIKYYGTFKEYLDNYVNKTGFLLRLFIL